jgi:putative nucleotidyltransferase with HDIG domain
MASNDTSSNGYWQPAEPPLKRILFVDDEVEVLDSLRDALRRYRHQWNVRFASSGEAALAELAAEPADVVVSDIQMPGMNGAALLAGIQQLHPATIRIVLSGYANHEFIARAAPAAHRILGKPCNVELLSLVLERSCTLHALSEVTEKYRLTVATTTLPSRPELYSEITDVIADLRSTPEDIAAVIERDVAMTAKVLQLANSAFFSDGRSVASVLDAVLNLGPETIKSLTVSAETFGSLVPASIHGFSLERFQEHAILVARIARGILPDGEAQQDAVTAALLHDIGKLVAITDDRERWDRLTVEARHRGLPRYAVEKDIEEVTHAATGAYLLALWGLPLGVVEAVAGHHDLTLLPRDSLDATAAVHIADALAHEVRPELGDGAPPVSLDCAALERLGVSGQLDRWRELATRAARATGEQPVAAAIAA